MFAYKDFYGVIYRLTSLESYIGSNKRHEDSVWILNTFTVFIQNTRIG